MNNENNINNLSQAFLKIKEIENLIKLNHNLFLDGLAANDSDMIKKHYDWGIDWLYNDFHKSFISRLRSLEPTTDTIYFLNSIDINKNNDSTLKSLNDKLKYEIKDKLHLKLSYSLSMDIFNWAVKEIPELYVHR